MSGEDGELKFLRNAGAYAGGFTPPFQITVFAVIIAPQIIN